MEQKYLFKNITGTAVALSLALSPMCSNSTVLISGNDMPKAHYSFHDNTSNFTNNGVIHNKIDNIYLQNKPNNLEKEATELFGVMREATLDEQKSVNNYIDSISTDTGVNFFNLC